MEIITSKNNNTIKLVTKLINNKKDRDEKGLFICETYRVFKQLENLNLEYVFIILNKNTKYFNEFKNKKNIYVVDEKIFNSISVLKSSDGIILCYKKIKNELKLEKKDKYIILDKIQNPKNLGNICRTACAFGITNLIIINGSVDIYNIETIRSSMGSVFNVKIYYSTNLKIVLEKLDNLQIPTYATSLTRNAKSILETKFPSSFAIGFGNEGNGIDKNDLVRFKNNIFIPISSNVDSLNINNAVAITLFVATNCNFTI
ncbi:MAG: RNA methyltransferase [Mycoplasmataceae bacterium]|jgi:TrmH family RNA methyltransferase|nr:RNA methyltransferase [Mycoplasmataceae bacterium]